MRGEPPAQVDVLQHSIGGTISCIDHDTSGIGFEGDHDWKGTHPLVHQGKVFQPLIVTSDKLWVDNVQDFDVGDRVVQNFQQGSLQDSTME